VNICSAPVEPNTHVVFPDPASNVHVPSAAADGPTDNIQTTLATNNPSHNRPEHATGLITPPRTTDSSTPAAPTTANVAKRSDPIFGHPRHRCQPRA
jgi:hypothetical protein